MKKTIALITVILLLCAAIFAYADIYQGNSTEIVYEERVYEPMVKDLLKPWTIPFNQPVDPETLNEENIYIKKMGSEEKHPISEIEILEGCETIIVTPAIEYEDDSIYYLYITENTRDLYKGKQIENPIRMQFTVSTQPLIISIDQEEGTILNGISPDYRFILSGTVNKQASVIINEIEAELEEQVFSEMILLDPGDNEILIQATDALGITETVILNVYYAKVEVDMQDLITVRDAMVRVANWVTTQPTKNLSWYIRDVLANMVDDVYYDYDAQRDIVQNMYYSLSHDERENFKDGLGRYIRMSLGNKMREIFGI